MRIERKNETRKVDEFYVFGFFAIIEGEINEIRFKTTVPFSKIEVINGLLFIDSMDEVIKNGGFVLSKGINIEIDLMKNPLSGAVIGIEYDQFHRLIERRG